MLIAETPRLSPDVIADLAVAALRAEAELTPKPGLVDQRGSGAHTDMDMGMLLASADALRDGLVACARAAQKLPLGVELRARVGVIGRTTERHMLAVTGGVNTHRGALWSLGLLAAGVARHGQAHRAIQFAAALALHPDPALRRPTNSHGDRARRRYGAVGAAGEARSGYPHVVGHALPTLRRARARGADETTARLDALLAVMAHLEDTCVLHRGGLGGLTAIRRGAAGVLAAGGSATRAGRRRLEELDDLARTRRLSPGGSGDLLSAALFLDFFATRQTEPRMPPCSPCRVHDVKASRWPD
jgi:triphosphoribosyl-dephospho-CoA synthase